MSRFGSFEGDVVAKWLVEPGRDRRMQLVEPFGFTDPVGKGWQALRDDVVDGASIPEMLWTVVGSPFVGSYRRAAVLHDVECERKTEPAADVHRMFYYAMRADDVPFGRAALMYAAVRVFGPDWTFSNGSAVPNVRPPMTWDDVSRVQQAVGVISGGRVDPGADPEALDALDRDVDLALTPRGLHRIDLISLECVEQNEAGTDEIRMTLTIDDRADRITLERKMAKGDVWELGRSIDFATEVAVDLVEIDPFRNDRLGSASIVSPSPGSYAFTGDDAHYVLTWE